MSATVSPAAPVVDGPPPPCLVLEFFRPPAGADDNDERGLRSPGGVNAWGLEVPVPPEFTRMRRGEDDVEWFAPVRPGDRITVRQRVADIQLKAGRSGYLLLIIRENEFVNQRGELLVDLRREADADDDVLADHGLEAGKLESDSVGADRDQRESEAARFAARGRLRLDERRARDRYSCTRQHGAGVVGDPANDFTGLDLRQRRHRTYQDSQHGHHGGKTHFHLQPPLGKVRDEILRPRLSTMCTIRPHSGGVLPWDCPVAWK